MTNACHHHHQKSTFSHVHELTIDQKLLKSQINVDSNLYAAVATKERAASDA
jgi:hypothetical protein